MALPECAGVFMRAHCPHPQLFEAEYKRCFPHCCPHHVDRSYCGSSLEVLLRFGPDSDVSQGVEQDTQSLAAPFDVANVFVFARFETVDGANPTAATYSLHYLRSISQSEVNPEASWIEGVRQTAADRQQRSQQPHGRQPPPSRSARGSSDRPESATFVLNGQTFAKWYYHWESGANKVQRATKHALKAYVLYQTQEAQTRGSVQGTSSQQGGPESAAQAQTEPTRDAELELLCVVTSPPFTVVSYRRAPLDASAAFAGSPMGGIDSASSLMPHYATDAAHPVDSRLRHLVQHQISRAFREYNQQQEPRGSSDSSFAPFASQDDEDQPEGGQFDRYRQLQEREGLRFRLLTPVGAALARSSLHGQIQSREPRLVFDSTRHRETQQHWRDTDQAYDEEFDESYEEDDIRDEAVPQPLASPHSTFELKSAGSIGMPPSTTDPARHAERVASVTLLRYKQQQHQLDNHQRELHQLTDLAIIHFFVSRISTNDARSAANLEAVLTIAISQHWHSTGGAIQLARLLRTFAKGGVGHGTTASGSDGAGSKSEEVLLVLAEVCVWAFSPTNFELVQSLLTACHPLLLDTLKSGGSGGNDDDARELRTAFLECAARCWGALDGFLQSPRASQSTIRSVRQLSDAVLGVVYSDPALEELRAGLKNMLQRPAIVLEDSKDNSPAGLDVHGSVTPRCNLPGWRGFLAQVREGYLRDQYSGRGPPWSPTQNSQPSRWSADWLLQPSTLSVASHADSQRRAVQAGDSGGFIQAGTTSPTIAVRDVPSMWTSCLVLSQLLHLKLAVVGDPLHTLYVQAEPSVLPRDNAWLRLICDGRVRVAPVVPNGLTSLMGGSSCSFGGDYVAYRLEHQDASNMDDGSRRSTQVSSSTSDQSLICIEFYWWPLSQTQGELQNRLVAFRSVVTLKTVASGAFVDGHVELERGFVEREAVAAAQSSEMELWTPTERVQSVTIWSPWLAIDGIYARK